MPAQLCHKFAIVLAIRAGAEDKRDLSIAASTLLLLHSLLYGKLEVHALADTGLPLEANRCNLRAAGCLGSDWPPGAGVGDRRCAGCAT